MERILEFQKVIQTLYQASGVLLGFIIVCTITQHHTGAGFITFFLVAIYGIYLYYHAKYKKPTTTGYFIAEIILILLLDWAGGYPMAVYLFLLLILRRAVFSKQPNIYIEAALIGLVYLVIQWLHGPRVDYVAWRHGICDVFIIGLAAVLAQPVVRITKVLQDDREKLLIKLNRAEESYQKAAELALRDGLTGLYNYRALQEHINSVGNTRFAFLLIDVDYFKDFNDQYGHIVGDHVLMKIGQLIMENVRRSDKVYRYGGEEFAVVLEDADEEVAMFTAERIRVRVANQAIECSGQLLNGVTVSTGVAIFKESQLSGYQILEQADKALYEAKARGRNNVVFFIEPGMSM